MKRFVVLLVGLLVAGCAPGSTVVLTDGTQTVTVAVELAVTAEQQEQGLMDRTELPEGQGMLFVFSEERPLTFWMKNTLIPLDILFFDGDMRFVSAATMLPCKQEPCHLYSSRVPAQYALEVPAGFVKTHDIAPDWSMKLQEAGER